MPFLKQRKLYAVSIFISLIGVSLHCSSQAAKNNFNLKGKIEGLQDGYAYFSRIIGNMMDSVKVINQEFDYTLPLKGFDYMYISFKDANGKTYPGAFMVPIEAKKKMNFSGTINNGFDWTFSGTKEADLTMKFRQSVLQNEKDYVNILSTLKREDGKMNVPAEKMNLLKGIIQDNNKKTYDFIDQNNHTHSAVLAIIYALNNNANESDPSYKKKLKERLENALNNEAAQSTIALELSQALTIGLAPQDKAPDFVQNNIEGKPISLSSFKGKYVLIDFWASWCGPCRYENPNVVQVYKTFKDKNFDVLGVSLDKDRESWINAIKKDNLTWTQVSDLKGFNNDVARLYNVRAIPGNFLVDPNGTIVATNLRGEELIKVLSSIFSK